MEIEGRLIQKLGIQSGKSARGDWAKQEFVIEYQDGNFPTKACFSVWGADKVKDLEHFQINDQIKVSFNVSSREYNGKWYTDLRAWRISAAGAQQPGYGAQGSFSGQQPGGFAPQGGQVPGGYPQGGGFAPQGGGYQQSNYDMSAGFAPSQQSAPAPSIDDMPGDDLPF